VTGGILLRAPHRSQAGGADCTAPWAGADLPSLLSTMDAALNRVRGREGALLWIALAPVVPQLLGSWFNIWYNVSVVDPLLASPELKRRFVEVCIGYNGIAYPLAIYVWLRCVYSLRPTLRRLRADESVPLDEMRKARCHVINLP